MESFLPDTVKAILLALIAIVFVLNRLSRRLPHVAWLQVFRLPVIQMSEEQRARRRRAGNQMAALEIVLAGLALPAVYFLSTIMFFSEPKTIPTMIVTACSILCIVLGIWIFAWNR
jgi:sterol desaturase/sphingolipid hydroxylase (fatty acid hydroxylase superfamily)